MNSSGLCNALGSDVGAVSLTAPCVNSEEDPTRGSEDRGGCTDLAAPPDTGDIVHPFIYFNVTSALAFISIGFVEGLPNKDYYEANGHADAEIPSALTSGRSHWLPRA